MVKTFLTTEITEVTEFVRDLLFSVISVPSVVTIKFTLLFWFRIRRVKHNLR